MYYRQGGGNGGGEGAKTGRVMIRIGGRSHHWRHLWQPGQQGGYPRLRGAPAGERRMPRLEAVPGAERPPPKKPGQGARGGGQEAQKKTEEPPLPPHQRGGAVRYVDWTNCPRCNFGFSPDQEKLRARTTEASKPPRLWWGEGVQKIMCPLVIGWIMFNCSWGWIFWEESQWTGGGMRLAEYTPPTTTRSKKKKDQQLRELRWRRVLPRRFHPMFI